MWIGIVQVRLIVAAFVVAHAGIASVAAAASPPGFKRVQLTNTPNDVEFNPRVSDCGDVVWSTRLKGSFDGEEIYLYSNGNTVRLTNDATRDTWPDINMNGTVVWARESGPGGDYGITTEIVRWREGEPELITDDDLYDWGPRINDDEEIVWNSTVEFGCSEAPIDGIRLFADGVVTKVYDDGASNQGPVQSAGRIVWTRYDFCLNPWESEILMLDSDGSIVQLSNGFEPQVPCISPTGVVGWNDANDLYTWNEGVVTRITDDGRNPFINSRGDIAFIRWNNSRKLWESWLYLGGEFRQIAASTRWEVTNDMNERGDIVVMSATKSLDRSEVVLYQRLPDGDMNCDEKVDFDDIDGFVEAITDRAVYEQNNRTCDWWLADCNGDRKIDFNDIDAFVDCLINNGCP